MRSNICEGYRNLAARRLLAGLVELTRRSPPTHYFHQEAILCAMPDNHDPRYGAVAVADVKGLLRQYRAQGLISRVSIYRREDRLLADGSATGYRANMKRKDDIERIIGGIDA